VGGVGLPLSAFPLSDPQLDNGVVDGSNMGEIVHTTRGRNHVEGRAVGEAAGVSSPRIDIAFVRCGGRGGRSSALHRPSRLADATPLAEEGRYEDEVMPAMDPLPGEFWDITG
jgi:hypothetical protein